MLVSPSASPPNTTQWFDTFFSECELLGCRVDYLGRYRVINNTFLYESMVSTW